MSDYYTPDQIVDPPSGDKAFEQVTLGWMLRLDMREFFHPAVQRALQDAYNHAHHEGDYPAITSYEKALVGSAFFHNYDEYALQVWRSNPIGRDKMIADFPQRKAPEPLPTLEDIDDQELRETVSSFVEHRRSLPVILGKQDLLRKEVIEQNKV